MPLKKVVLLIAIAVAVSCFFIFDLGQYLSLDYLQSQKSALLELKDQHPFEAALAYFIVYVLVTALSLPAAAVVTLAGGAIFGVMQGVILVSFASTIGATIAFLIARTILRDSVEQKFSDSFAKINRGVSKEGAFYLFGLRLVPVFPFFAVNLLLGRTQMRVGTYFVVSQLGMLPGTIVYVNAGTQLGQLESLSGIVSPGLLLSFALLGILPFVSKRILNALQAQKVYRGYSKPDTFDTNMVVIGAGSGGLVTAYIAAATKAKVTLIEKHKMGGDCLNTGCVPSKAFIRSASAAHQVKTAQDYGLSDAYAQVNFAEVMERVQRVIGKIEPHDSIERYTELGVDCIEGEARIVDPYHGQVNGQTLRTKNIVIATGARPSLPDIPGLPDCPYYTSDTIWNLREQPKRLVVLGAGPIGCELAQSFQRLGTHVTLVNRSNRILPKEDPDTVQFVRDRLEHEGVQLVLGTADLDIQQNAESRASYTLSLSHQGISKRYDFDCLLVATGRTPNVTGFGLEELGIELTEKGTIAVNEHLQTKYPNIYAVGDVTGPFQLTHAASHQAWYAAVNGLFGSLKRFKVDYRYIPWATFTDPEIARVGLSETEARERNIAYEVTTYPLDDLDRAIADGSDYGVVKVLTVPGKDKILGACIVGKHAGDLLAEFVLAMKHGLGLNKILGTIHIYPTLSEANKFTAGEWRKARKPEGLLGWVERYHTFNRG